MFKSGFLIKSSQKMMVLIILVGNCWFVESTGNGVSRQISGKKVFLDDVCQKIDIFDKRCSWNFLSLLNPLEMGFLIRFHPKSDIFF